MTTILDHRPDTVTPARTALRQRGGAWRSALARTVRWRKELGLFLLAYAAYSLARIVFEGGLGPARANAHWIWDLEQSAGIAVERSVQGALDAPAVAMVLSNVYLLAQLVVLPGSLIWLYRRSRPVYRSLRNTIVATWLIAVPIHALFPVAPPRLAGLDFADTVTDHGAVSMTGSSTMFFNEFAAVPSLHVGFAFAIGIAAAAALRGPRAKALALAWGPVVTLAVIATGNHYVFDAIVGLLVTVAGWLAGRAASAVPAPAVRPARRRVHRLGPCMAGS